MWLGPMFFGRYDTVWDVPVKTKDCATLETTESRPGPWEKVDASEHPEHVIVLNRRTGRPNNGEVWFVGPSITDLPKRVAVLQKRPHSATLCADVLYVGEEDDGSRGSGL